MGSSSHSYNIQSEITPSPTMEAAQPRLVFTAATYDWSMCETRRLPIHLLSRRHGCIWGALPSPFLSALSPNSFES